MPTSSLYLLIIKGKVGLLIVLNALLFLYLLIIIGKVGLLIVLYAHLFSIPSYY